MRGESLDGLRNTVYIYLFSNVYVSMLFLYVSVLLPVAVTVWIAQEEYIKGLSHSFKNILQGESKDKHNFCYFPMTARSTCQSLQKCKCDFLLFDSTNR